MPKPDPLPPIAPPPDPPTPNDKADRNAFARHFFEYWNRRYGRLDLHDTARTFVGLGFVETQRAGLANKFSNDGRMDRTRFGERLADRIAGALAYVSKDGKERSFGCSNEMAAIAQSLEDIKKRMSAVGIYWPYERSAEEPDIGKVVDENLFVDNFNLGSDPIAGLIELTLNAAKTHDANREMFDGDGMERDVADGNSSVAAIVFKTTMFELGPSIWWKNPKAIYGHLGMPLMDLACAWSGFEPDVDTYKGEDRKTKLSRRARHWATIVRDKWY